MFKVKFIMFLQSLSLYQSCSISSSVSSCFFTIVHLNLPDIFENIAGVGDGEKIVVN